MKGDCKISVSGDEITMVTPNGVRHARIGVTYKHKTKDGLEATIVKILDAEHALVRSSHQTIPKRIAQVLRDYVPLERYARARTARASERAEPVVSMDEVCALLREQNDLMRQLLACWGAKLGEPGGAA